MIATVLRIAGHLTAIVGATLIGAVLGVGCAEVTPMACDSVLGHMHPISVKTRADQDQGRFCSAMMLAAMGGFATLAGLYCEDQKAEQRQC